MSRGLNKVMIMLDKLPENNTFEASSKNSSNDE